MYIMSNNKTPTICRNTPIRLVLKRWKNVRHTANCTVWQDVYKTNTAHGEVYLKITVIDDVLIVSFKEL